MQLACFVTLPKPRGYQEEIQASWLPGNSVLVDAARSNEIN